MRFWRRSGQSSNAGGFRRWFRQVVTNRKTPRNFKRKEGRSGYDTKIMSWRTRELSTIPFDLVQAKIRTSGFGEVRKAHDWVLHNIRWKSDQAVHGRKDFWATSNEVLRRKEDDCIANYEEIYVREGIRKVGDLKVGDEVLSYDFNTEKFCYKSITKIWEKGVQQLKRVKTSHSLNFRHVDVTSGTPFLSRANSGKKVTYTRRQLKDINIKNDRLRKIPVAKKIPYNVVDITWLTKELCFVVGHFLAEGWVERKNGKGRRAFTSGYGIEEVVTPVLDEEGIPYSSFTNNSGVPYISFLKSDFRNFISPLLFNSMDIRLSEEILHLPKEKLQSLLDGYYYGDGHFHRKAKYYSTSSDQLAMDLVRIHLQIGLPIGGYLQLNHQGFGKNPIWRMHSHPDNRCFKDYGYQDLGEAGIVELDDIEPAETRDFEVEDTHVFFLKNGMMCHNCDGQAVAMWRKMRDAGLGDDRIGMELLVGNRQGHMIAFYQPTPEDFYVLDNGYLTLDIVLASELFADSVRCKNMRPVAGFNLWESWIH